MYTAICTRLEMARRAQRLQGSVQNDVAGGAGPCNSTMYNNSTNDRVASFVSLFCTDPLPQRNHFPRPVLMLANIDPADFGRVYRAN